MISENEIAVTNGSISVCTERGLNIGPRGTSETHVSFRVCNGMALGVMRNNADTRRFLRNALRRMENEIKRNKKARL